MTVTARRVALLSAVLLGGFAAGLGTGSSFFFAADQETSRVVDEAFAERLRSLRIPRFGGQGSADGSGELHAWLLWPLRMLAALFVLAVCAALTYAVVRAAAGLRALRRLRRLRSTACRRGDDYADERSTDDAVTALRRRLRDGIDAGVAQLEGTAPSREVVIACYQELERAAADAGTARAPADTPSELVVRMLAGHHVPAASAETLVALYEQARFSPHPVDDSMRAAARRCLDDVRRALVPS